MDRENWCVERDVRYSKRRVGNIPSAELQDTAFRAHHNSCHVMVGKIKRHFAHPTGLFHCHAGNIRKQRKELTTALANSETNTAAFMVGYTTR